MIISDRSSKVALVEGYVNWLRSAALRGAKLYYVNFMFEELNCPKQDLIHRMRWSIERFYSRLLTQFVRRPRAPKERHKMPEFWLFPDLPVHKTQRQTLSDISINNGLHFNGPMVINAPLRKSNGLGIKKHFRIYAARYTKNGIIRIDVQTLDLDYSRLIDYALKTVTADRVDPGDILILPKSRMELSTRMPCQSGHQRALKGVMSAYNLSFETAEQLLIK